VSVWAGLLIVLGGVAVLVLGFLAVLVFYILTEAPNDSQEEWMNRGR
jgi:hypothetical protein